jgi:hypothetical protein
MERVEVLKQFSTIEQRALCMNDAKKINSWFKELTRQDNSIVMQVTERAKTVTLYHIIVEYNLNTREIELSRPKMISLVRKEVNKQKKNSNDE